MKVITALCLAALLQPDVCLADDESLLFSRITGCGDMPCDVQFFQEFLPSGSDLYEKVIFFWRGDWRGDWRGNDSQDSVDADDGQTKHVSTDREEGEDKKPPPLSWGFVALFLSLGIIYWNKRRPCAIRQPSRSFNGELHGS